MSLPLETRLQPAFLEGIADLLVASYRDSGDRRLGMLRLEMQESVAIERFDTGSFVIMGGGDCWDSTPQRTASDAAENRAVLLLAAALAVRKLKDADKRSRHGRPR